MFDLAGAISEQYKAVQALWKNKRMFAFQALNLAIIFLTALMIWKGLMVYTNSESPVVVVLSGSMRPALKRGDILFLNNSPDPIKTGDIVVFKIEDREIPIVHRVLKVHSQGEEYASTAEFLTKGDNNNVNDRGLYQQDQMWLRRDQILGRATASVPKVGMMTILLNEYPLFKYLLVGSMAILVLTSTE